MANEELGICNATNQAVIAWVEQKIKLCEPDQVFWCDGSERKRSN